MVGEVTAALTALRAGFKTSGGLATPSAMPGGAGVAGPSTPSTKRKHEETESPDKEEQESRKRPHPDPGSTSPTGPPKKAPKKSPSTPPKKAESPGEKSKSPKGKGRAVSKTPSPRAATEKGRPSSQGKAPFKRPPHERPPLVDFTTPNYQGRTRSQRSTTTPISPKGKRKTPPGKSQNKSP
ncbi:hypothetical protein MMC08_005720 [Hypocenomyce scalaris]|nr:hypothetical protein [Hypocenomyce scalaris]